MSLKTKVILLLIISNLFLFAIYISLANKGLAEAYAFTEMPQFNSTLEKSVTLFNKSNDVSAQEKAEYKRSATALMTEYSQREIFKEEITNRLLMLIFCYFLPFMVLVLLAVYVIFARFTAPLNKLAKAMEKYPDALDEDLKAPSGRSETAILYDRFGLMKQKIVEYESLLRKQEKVSGWMEMSRAIVHEMNNFLMPLENHLNNLNKKAVEQSELQDELVKVNRSFAATRNVIANMRNFYSARRSEPEQVNLNDDLEFICSGYQAEFVATDGVIETVVDRLELNQAIVNLIKNGKESVPEDRNPQISVKLSKVSSFISITVQDNGKGISEPDLAKIFDPGFTSKKNGLGFGLALVQKIVTLNRWEIKVKSEINQGSCFELLIPSKQ